LAANINLITEDMKSFKRRIRIIKNFFGFVLTAPDYVKIVKYQSPGEMATLISIFLWFSLFFFAFASIIHKFGNDAGHWYSEFVNNPNLLIGKPFVLGVVLLSLFYLQATWRDLWDFEAIKKELEAPESKKTSNAD
jgi:hypothetical protein